MKTKKTTQKAIDSPSWRIKDWKKFQHFRDRNPPWIKLHKQLIDDPDWHSLDAKSAKILVMLWIIASECKDLDGKLPPIRTLSFRLRVTENAINDAFANLSHYLIQDDITLISSRYQLDAPETEKEAKTEKNGDIQTKKKLTTIQKAERIYNEYPKKVGRAKAIQSIVAALNDGADANDVGDAVMAYAQAVSKWTKEERAFVPNPSTWFNQQRWLDDQTEWFSRCKSTGGDENYRIA